MAKCVIKFEIFKIRIKNCGTCNKNIKMIKTFSEQLLQR